MVVSKTMWAIIALFLPTLSEKLGFDVEQATKEIYEAVCGLLAIYFRYRAQVKIDGLKDIISAVGK